MDHSLFNDKANKNFIAPLSHITQLT